MKTKEEYLAQLISNRQLHSTEEIELYEAAADYLFIETDITSMEALIKGFLDETENLDLMWSLLHEIEFFCRKFGDRVYILKLVPLLKNLEIDAYDWSEIFFSRLLNSDEGDEAFEILLSELSGFEEKDKIYITKLTKGLMASNPERFAEKGLKILNNG